MWLLVGGLLQGLWAGVGLPALQRGWQSGTQRGILRALLQALIVPNTLPTEAMHLLQLAHAHSSADIGYEPKPAKGSTSSGVVH